MAESTWEEGAFSVWIQSSPSPKSHLLDLNLLLRPDLGLGLGLVGENGTQGIGVKVKMFQLAHIAYFIFVFNYFTEVVMIVE